MIRLALLTALAVAATPAGARAPTAPRIAGEMEGSARQSLLTRCGADPRCAAFGRPSIRIAGLTCRDGKKDHVRTRSCAFTAVSEGRSNRLSCTATFHQGPGSTPTLWSDRTLVRQVRVYLPTSNMNAPMTLGPSTLSCSGSVIDYVS